MRVKVERGIFKLETGRYQARLKIDGRDVTHTFGRLTDARKWSNEKRVERDTGVRSGIADLTFAELIESTAWSRHTNPLTPSTNRIYTASLLRAVKSFGSRKLSALTKEDVNRHLDSLSVRLSNGSLNQDLRVLRTILSVAVDSELIAGNVASRVKKRDDSEVKLDRRRLSPGEREKLLFHIPERYLLLVKLLFTTAMRSGEALALRWRDIDLEMDKINVSGTLRRESGLPFTVGPTKTKKSTRTVPIHSRLKPDLKNASAGQYPDSFVFCTLDGVNPLTYANVRRMWSKSFKDAGVEYVVLHGVRIDAISTMIEGGATPREVADIAGHSSTSTTMDIYAKSSPDRLKAAIELL